MRQRAWEWKQRGLQWCAGMAMLGLVACGGSGDKGGVTDPPDPPGGTTPTVAVALGGATASIVQGGSSTVAVTVTRGGGFAGAVALALEGAPAGVSGTFTPASVAAGSGTSTLALAVTAAAAAGNHTLTVRASGSGVTAATATLALAITAPPATGDFSIALAPAALNATVAGAAATTTATVARINGYAAAVALTVTGAPAGVTATVAPTSLTTAASTAIVSVSAAASATAGTYTLTVRATGAGVAERAAALTVTVLPAPGGGGTGSIAWSFCAPTIPAWLAVQDGNGPWTRVAGTNDSYRFDLPSGRGGVAVVTLATDGTPSTMIQYGTSAELGDIGARQCNPALGPKTVNASVAGLGALGQAWVALGGAATVVTPAQAGNFQLARVANGPLDLVAARVSMTINGAAIGTDMDRLIVRRNLNPADGSTLPVIDFGGAESFAPVKRSVAVGNAGGDQTMVSMAYFTNASGVAGQGGGVALYADISPAAGTTREFSAMPAEKQAANDLHIMSVAAIPTGAPAGGVATNVRVVTKVFRTAADQTATLGPVLTAPTVTSTTTAGTARPRTQLAVQAGYDRMWSVGFSQTVNGSASVTIAATDGWLNGAATLDVSVPDFSAVAGWSALWGLKPGINTIWQLSASGWTLPGATQPTADGAVVLTGQRGGQLTP